MDGRNDDDVAVVFVFVDVAEKLMTMFHPRNKQNCVYGKPKIKKRKKSHVLLTAKTPSASSPCKHNQ